MIILYLLFILLCIFLIYKLITRSSNRELYKESNEYESVNLFTLYFNESLDFVVKELKINKINVLTTGTTDGRFNRPFIINRPVMNGDKVDYVIEFKESKQLIKGNDNVFSGGIDINNNKKI